MPRKYIDILRLLCFLVVFAAVNAVSAVGAVGAAVENTELDKEANIWSEAGFVSPKVEFISTKEFYKEDRQVFTHSLDLTLVMFRGAGWNKRMVLQRLKKAADIYAQCGVQLGQVKLVETGAPGGIIDFCSPGSGDVEIAKKVPPTSRPVFFYFRSIPKFNAYAWPESSENEEIAGELKNTAWFSLSVTMKLNIKIRHPKYVSEAHELGHILLDSLAHARKGTSNLMAEGYEYENDRLTPEQCRKIKEHHLVKPLYLP